MRTLVAGVLVETIRSLELTAPTVSPEQHAANVEARRLLEAEQQLRAATSAATVGAVTAIEVRPEHEALRSLVHDFAEAEIAPHAEAWDRDHTFPLDTVKQMGELGLFGLPFPEAYGGGGGDLTALCIAIEEIARADQSLAITLEAAVGLGATPIHRFGTEEQRLRWLPDLCAGTALAAFGLTEPDAGSDAGGLRTKADARRRRRVGDRRREGLHHQLGHGDHLGHHHRRPHRSRARPAPSSSRPAPPAWRSSRRTARWGGTPPTRTASPSTVAACRPTTSSASRAAAWRSSWPCWTRAGSPSRRWPPASSGPASSTP